MDIGRILHMYAETLRAGRWEHANNDVLERRSEHGHEILSMPPEKMVSHGDLSPCECLAGALSDEEVVAGHHPIIPPRGIPTDLSQEVRQMLEQYEGAGEPARWAGWVTTAEVLAYPWHEQMLHERGYVKPQDAVRYHETGAIPEMCREQLTGTEPDYSEWLTWQIPFADYYQHFLTVTVPTLLTLGDPEMVRLVFWVDW